MPVGIYKRIPEMKTGKYKHTKEHNRNISKGLKGKPSGSLGKHWKWSEDAKKRARNRQHKKGYKIKDTSKYILAHREGRAGGFKMGHEDFVSPEGHKRQGQKMRILRLKEISNGTGTWGKFKDTKIELLYEQTLKDKGLKEKIDYLKQQLIKNITVSDFYLIKGNIHVFIDGCYWHGCPKHHPNTHPEKVRKDKQNNRKMKQLGIKFIRIREHDVKGNKYQRTPPQKRF